MSPVPTETDWRNQVRELAKRDPRGLAGVAERIGISRSGLSMLLDDKYPGNPKQAKAKVLLFLGQGQLMCPFLQREIADGDCRAYRCRPQPTSIPSELRHWLACQSCTMGAAVSQATPVQRDEEASHVSA